MPTALVTGATGQVGSHIIERVRREGWALRALVRMPDAARWLGGDVSLVRGDVTDASSFQAAAKGCDIIFHAAATVTSPGGWEEYQALNLEGTRNAIHAARDNGARLMHVSSVAVYGPGMRYQSGRLTDEDSTLETLSDDQYYPRSKRDSERMVLDAHAAGEIWATTIRPDVIYGRRDRQFVPRIARLLSSGFAPMIDGGRTALPIIHAASVAEAAWLAATTDAAAGRAYNIANEAPISSREFFTLGGEGLGKRVVGVPIPKPLAMLMLRAAVNIIGLIRGKGLRAISGGTLDFLTRGNPFTSQRAHEELGWKPVTDPRVEIPDAFRWWKTDRMQKGRDHSRPPR